MSENNNTQTQAQEITLTLNPEEELAKIQEVQTQEAKTKTVEELYADAKLTEAERKTVDDFSKKIDITESSTVLEYGSAAQKKVSDFSDSALKNVRTKDLGEIGNLLSDLVVELKTTDDGKQDKGFFGNLFKKGTDSVIKYKARYDKAEANVDKIAAILEDHQITLLKDIALLDQLYERNAQNTKELSMYIIAGKKKLQEVRENELPALVKKAQESGLPEDAQAAGRAAFGAVGTVCRILVHDRDPGDPVSVFCGRRTDGSGSQCVEYGFLWLLCGIFPDLEAHPPKRLA